MTHLYTKPSFSCDKPYYSLVSSITMLLLSFYLLYRQKPIAYLVLIVSILSIFHHCRSYSDFPPSLSKETDLLQVVDFLFALCLGVILFRQNTYNKIIISIIIFLYFNILLIFLDYPHIQSFLHMVIHLLVVHMLLHGLHSKHNINKKINRRRCNK